MSAILADVLGVAMLLVFNDKVVAVGLSAILADVLGVVMLLVFCEFVAVDIPPILVDVVGTVGCRGAVEEITWQFTAASILLYYNMGVKMCIYAINRTVFLFYTHLVTSITNLVHVFNLEQM